MMASGSGLPRMLMVVALTLGLMAALPVTSLAQGNSENAHLCNQGGWEVAVRADTGAGFSSQGDCVSYGAQGGTVVALSGIVIPAGRSATISGYFSGCNGLRARYTTSSGDEEQLGWSIDCYEKNAFNTVTTPVYADVVTLTITLSDWYCYGQYDSSGDHALVTPIVGGYQVDIMDGGDCSLASVPRYPSGPGAGNLSVQVIIN